MPFYRVIIRGTRVPFDHGASGFFTTRFVQALTMHRAELKAVESVKREITARIPVEALKAADARIFLKEIEQIAKLPCNRGGGASWFDESVDGPEAALDMERRAFR